MNGDTWKGIGIGLLIGAAVGATLGILYAPRSGKETRTIIRDKAGNMVKSVKSRFSRDKAAEEEEIAEVAE
jgi:gas vesicle protein